MSPRAIAYGQLRAALAVVVQAGKTLEEDHSINGQQAELSQPSWRRITTHLDEAAKNCLLAMNILTEP